MKKILLTLLLITPVILLASDAGVETDILQRSVNFVIFAFIIYYLLADKLKAFFSDRTKSIQSDLDKVQELLKASEKKISDAKEEIESAKKIAGDLVTSANADVEAIKKKIDDTVEQEIANLEKLSKEKEEVEARKVKKEVVKNVLDQLMSDDSINLSQDDLANIILKKVA